MDAFTYILECADGTFYTGWTSDLEKRLADHNSKKGAKYTRCRVPVKLVYFESFITKQEAQKREYAIKQLKRDQKLQLISNFEPKPF
jgi:putative endonuclease